LKNIHIILPVYLIFNILLLNRIEAQNLAKGRITDTVICINHADQSYSLYLPSGYSQKTKWPVILIFDPGGQGTVAIQAFRKAAEKYGYILACSNNSRNGPLNDNFLAAGYMFNDLAQRFALDEKQIFAAGFSGASRFALALASTNNFIAGVIGCGAGLPNDQSLMPSEKSSFVYYGIAGNRDMNYLEMFDLMTFFNNRTPVIPYLRTFDGGHQWPSPEILQEAVEWINLQLMKKKITANDTAYFSFCSKKIKTLVNNLTTSGNQYDAARYLRYAIRDFSGEPVSHEFTRSLTVIEQSRDYKESSREWNNIASQERVRNENYMSVLGKLLSSGSVPDTASSWWKKEVGSHVLMKDNGNPLKSQMASRLLNFISILCSEQGTSFFRQKKYDISGFLFKICTLSDSENKNNYYNLARSLSGLNKKQEAIEALNKAYDHGLNSRKTIEMEPVFNNIRNDEKYKSLLMKMK
jgi:tetratricopeptide (TPR) repeat protein